MFCALRQKTGDRTSERIFEDGCLGEDGMELELLLKQVSRNSGGGCIF
jgi:hypothetical protein